jgi:RHH-type proline utilization regulon transcriptional repressor/proline dehydrogenase/delta 1-pyrroline-5-carboxylate dehydrogenase
MPREPHARQDEDPLLLQLAVDAASSHPIEVQQAVQLARLLGERAAELQTPQERRQQAELDRMISSPGDKVTLMQLTDQAVRSQRPPRAADQLIHILDVQGVPRFFSPLDRTLLKGFQSFGAYLPGVAMPLVEEKMHQETANVILPAEPELLAEHLQARREEGLRMNVNHLGEALLGEDDAQRRLSTYLATLQQPEIEVISVKISTIYSQISTLAREQTIEVVSDRLELLYRAAAKARFTRYDGTVVPKFVYLDMEEYRDKELTAEIFMRTLDRPGLEKVAAGIALQAYIPDSFLTQQRINEWARRRVAQGGAPVTIRVVKGANLEMERVEASIRGWPQAPYKTKLETDANYLRMLTEGFRPENLSAVRLGIASHNLFSLAYGMVLAARAKASDRVQFEMLEGMANHQRRALFELTQNMLLYAPACRQDEFTTAIGYLIRRLDENTGPNNFLRHAFHIRVGSETWQQLERQFIEAFEMMESVSAAPRRSQDRNQRAGASPPPRSSLENGGEEAPARFVDFDNEPDTDWSLPRNTEWAQSIVAKWKPLFGDKAANIPLVIAGDEIQDGRTTRESMDPSQPGTVVARYQQATTADVDRAVAAAREDASGWRRLSASERQEMLYRVADELAAARGELMGAMLAEGGKTLAEGDSEVSEAIDFCRFYSDSAAYFHELGRMDNPVRRTREQDGQDCPSYGWFKCRGRGVVAVVSPWNFPLAIPCGGVAAALAAGNTVILKPASDTVLIAYKLAECFWLAGVSKHALQFVPCAGNDVAQDLVSHDGVDAVILTGGTATAARMLANKPTMNLFAETGGKNATIITSLSDRDLAIKNVLHGAFSHSGQKCSATSLLILESEVYHDAKFRTQFCDAVESLQVGSAWDLATKVGPLIRPPSGELEAALKELEPGEEWAVMPRLHVDGNPHLVSPGVKWGVRPKSVTHCTEFFGPVLGVMEARDLDEAIDLVNATGYGLTSGLESLDDREQQRWQEHVRAGNLYINRPTTGAIVLRQPFGGMGKSSVGPGIKAGGPNYVVPLMTFDGGEAEVSQSAPATWQFSGTDTNRPELLVELYSSLRDYMVTTTTSPFDAADVERAITAIESYQHWAREEFHAEHDQFRLLGEDNFRRYRPVEHLRIRAHQDDTFFDVFSRATAARAAGCRTTISSPTELADVAKEAVELLDSLTDSWGAAIEFVTERDEELCCLIESHQTDRVRFAAPDRVPQAVRRAAAESLQYIADTPPIVHGRVELLWYFQEQSLSVAYHRYGNLGARVNETRDEPL